MRRRPEISRPPNRRSVIEISQPRPWTWRPGNEAEVSAPRRGLQLAAENFEGRRLCEALRDHAEGYQELRN